uniref:ATP-dependent Clp protease proteolytic subunit n=1 Tax=Wollemia nobilis TaxID=56998 RepID=A0A0C9QS12_9CONI
MAASSASLCSSIHTSNSFQRTPNPVNYCNPNSLLLKKQPLEQKYSLHLQSKVKNNQQQRLFNVKATTGLREINGDFSSSAPWPSPSISADQGHNSIRAAKGNPPLMPAIRTSGGFVDLMSVLLRSRTIFLGQYVNSQVAQQVISQLVTLAAIDPDADILMYLNCPGGSLYSVMAIYDCMSWIKPKVGTVCFGVAASHGALLLAGGEKGMRYAMPNCRIMIHQPQGGMGGDVLAVSRQVNELCSNRDKIDKMYAAFTGQPLEIIKIYTDRDRFFSAGEALDFGLIDGILETEY